MNMNYEKGQEIHISSFIIHIFPKVGVAGFEPTAPTTPK